LETLDKARKQKKVRKVMKAMNEFMDEDKTCVPALYKPRYSGPNRTGICKCGHSWEDHHLGCVMNKEYGDATQEAYVPQECCTKTANGKTTATATKIKERIDEHQNEKQ
jgi:hypothetical protein